MRPDQLDSFASVTEPALSPDGARVLVTVSRMDLEEDRYERRLHLWQDGRLREFTAGPDDSGARWSPDGSRLAFLRRTGDIAQVAVMAADGGEATVVSEAPRGVRAVEWADDQMLVAHWVEWAEGYEIDDDRARRPRRITSIPYRFDDLGWTHDTRHRVTVLDADSAGWHLHLTEPMERFSRFAVDGDRVLFLADRTGRAVGDFERELYTVPLAGGTIETMAPLGRWTLVVASPEGPVLVGGPSGEDWPDNQRPFLLGPEGPVEMAPELDRSTVLVFGSPVVPVATVDGLVTLLEDGGRVGISRITGGSVEDLVGGDRYVTGFSSAEGTIAFTASSPTDPGELWLLDSDGERQVTGFNATVAAELALVEPTRFQVDGDGGPIDAWVLLPPGDEPVPVLLNVHGGPASQYGEVFFDEFQVYVSAGYGVVACNPRGSSGRGRAWMRGVAGDGWGTNDLADIHAVVDAALDGFPRLDRHRMGVMGGSYGGFMTAWLTARDRRFRSAVVERALISWPSFWGTSDIGTSFTGLYTGADMPDGAAELWAKSPLEAAGEIATPTLILHSEDDHRCPIEQAEQLFAALLKAGTPAELLRFPGESHELSRSGSPRHRQERFDAILEWHDRWLRDDLSPPTGKV